MAATAWLVDNYPHCLQEGSFANLLSTDVLKCILVTAVPAQTVTCKADVVANEVANGNGYATGGATIASKTCTLAAHVTSFGWANITWSAATITAKAAVIYSDTSTSPSADMIVMVVNLNGGADVSSTAGDFTISWTAVSNVAFTTTVATAT